VIVYHPETQTVTMDLDELRDLYDMRANRYSERDLRLIEKVEAALNEAYGE
jgi:hypothetical protein